MKVLLFVLIFGLSVFAQSPATSNLFSKATGHANSGRFDDAAKNFKTTLFMAENEYLGAGYRARLHYNIGVCYFHLDRFDLAVDQFKSALLLKPDYTRAHYARGMAELRQQNWKAAAGSFERVVKLDPKNGEAWFDLAFARIALNDLRTAENAFARSIAFGSMDSPLSHNNIGVILAVRGDLVGAERAFEAAVTLSGNRLNEAKRNLEFCRQKRLGKPELIATQFQYAVRRELPWLG